MKRKHINLLNKEIELDYNDFIVSKTNEKGIITYCNEIFMQIAGYNESELLKKNHNIIRHPHMPKAAFKLCWELISSKKEFFGFVKNLRKDGAYYWVFANITPDYDENEQIIGYTSVRRKPNPQAIEIIEPIYKQMLELEKSQNVQASTHFLMNILDEKQLSYNDLITHLQGI